MKNLNIYLIVIIQVLFCCSVINCVNDHSFKLLPLVEGEQNFEAASTLCQTAFNTETVNVFGYVATITNSKEWLDISDEILAGSPTNKFILISGSMDENSTISYNSGPESKAPNQVNREFYNHKTGECFGFCYFDVNQPQFIEGSNIMISNPSDNPTNSFWINSITQLPDSVLCEAGGLSEDGSTLTEVLSQTLPTIGGPLTILSNGIDAPNAGINVTFTSLSSENEEFTITYPELIPAGNSGDVYIGKYQNVGQDEVEFIFSYQIPFITSYYSPINEVNVITVVGNNFGADPSKITFSTFSGSCTDNIMLKDHIAFSCTLQNPLTTSYSPLSIEINSFKYPKVSRVATYDYSENLFILNNYQEMTNFIEFEGNLGAQTAYSTCLTTQNQIDLVLSNSFDSDLTDQDNVYYLGATYDGTTQKFTSVKDGSEILCIGNLPTDDSASTWTNDDQLVIDLGTVPPTITLATEGTFYSTLSFFSSSEPKLIETTEFEITANTDGTTKVTILPVNNGFEYSGVYSLTSILVQESLPADSEAVSVNCSLLTGCIYTVKSGYQSYELTSITTVPGDFNLIGETPFSITYELPEITSLSNPNTDGTESLTITGTNFYNNISLIQVLYPSSNPESPDPVSLCQSDIEFLTDNTQFTCTVAPGTGTISGVFLTLNDVQSTNTKTFSYASPLITEINECVTLAQLSGLTITGSNFGTDVTKISIKIDQVDCENVTIITDETKLACDVPTSSDLPELKLTVTVNTLSNVDPYQIDCGPMITGIEPTLLPFGISTDTVLTINGNEFVEQDLTVTIDGKECEVKEFTTSSIQCTLSEWPQTQSTVISVLFNGITTPITSTLTYTELTVTSFEQSLTGDSVTITGDSFGDCGDAITVVSKINATHILQPCSQETYNGPIICTLPSDVISSIYTVKNAISSNDYTFYLTPIIESISQTLVTTIPSNFTINGKFFETNSINTDNIILVKENNVEYDTFSGLTSTSLLYSYQSNSGKDIPIQIIIKTDNIVRESNTLTFSFIPPAITEVTITENIISIFGTNFGDDIDHITVNGIAQEFIESAEIDDHSELSDYYLLLVIKPSHPIAIPPLSLTVSGQTSEPTGAFEFKPVIKSLDPSKPLTSGQMVTVHGFFLEQNNLNYMDSFNGSRILLECFFVDDTDNTQSECQIPAGDGKFDIVIKTSETSPMTLPFESYYQEPIVTDITLLYNEEIKVIYVTITGDSFGTYTLPKVFFNATECTDVKLDGIHNVICTISNTEPLSNIGETTVEIQVESLQFSRTNLTLSYPNNCGECSGAGICTIQNTCYCNVGHYGDDCSSNGVEKKESNGWKIALGILLPLLVIVSLIALVAYLRHRKRNSYNRYSNKYFMDLDNNSNFN